jgi:hypothetical protein
LDESPIVESEEVQPGVILDFNVDGLQPPLISVVRRVTPQDKVTRA